MLSPNDRHYASGLSSEPSHSRAASVWGIVAIVGSLVGWTTIPLFLHHFSLAPPERRIDPWAANGWRYGFSALIWLPVLLPAALVPWLRKDPLPKGIWKAALVPSLFNAPAQICFGLAPYYVAPGLMTFSLRVQIVFLTIGAAILFAAERRVIRSPGFLVGILCVIVGTIATIAQEPEGLGGGANPALGISLAVGSGLLYAGYALAVRKFMVGMNPIAAFAIVSQYTAVMLVVPMLLISRRAGLYVLDLQGRELFLLGLSALIGIGIGHTLYFFAISRLGVAVSAGVVQLQPITVSIGSMILFDEILTPGQWASGVVAVAGAGVMLWTQHRLGKAAREAALAGTPRPPVAGADPAFSNLPPDGDVAALEAAADRR